MQLSDLRRRCRLKAPQDHAGFKSKAAGPPPRSFVVRRRRESQRPLVSKRLMKSYVGLHGASSSQDKLCACPADTFFYDWPSLIFQARSMHSQPEFDY